MLITESCRTYCLSEETWWRGGGGERILQDSLLIGEGKRGSCRTCCLPVEMSGILQDFLLTGGDARGSFKDFLLTGEDVGGAARGSCRNYYFSGEREGRRGRGAFWDLLLYHRTGWVLWVARWVLWRPVVSKVGAVGTYGKQGKGCGRPVKLWGRWKVLLISTIFWYSVPSCIYIYIYELHWFARY